MSKVEIRVRPVVRHIVTRYTERQPLPEGQKSDGPRASLETLGEFDSEARAEEMADAVRSAMPKPRQFAAVERNHFDFLTNVIYFDAEEDALAYAEHARSQGREFRVYSREITDPVALAHHEMGMRSYGFPGGIAEVKLPPEPPGPIKHQSEDIFPLSALGVKA
jgi:hypothetical protein